MKASTREQLARRIAQKVKVVCLTLKELKPEILQLWREFKKLKPGETIMGCKTEKEFCRKILHRTPRAVQHLLYGRTKEPAGEHCSPTPDKIIEDTWRIVSGLSSEAMVLCVPALVERLKNRPLQTTEEIKTVAAIANAMQEAIQRLSESLAELKPFVTFRKVA